MPGIIECYKKPLDRSCDYEALKDEPLIELDTIGLKGSPTDICTSPSLLPQKGAGVMLEGADKATAAELVCQPAEEARHLIERRAIHYGF